MSVVLDIQPSEDYEPSDNEIVEYGKWLGMTFPEDLPFLWIAREGLKAPLPEHWKACKSEKGELYYFNFKTGESIWDHPLDEHYKELYKREKENPTPRSVLNRAKRESVKSEEKKSTRAQKLVTQKQKYVKGEQEKFNPKSIVLDNRAKVEAINNSSKEKNLQIKNNNTMLNDVIVKREIPHELRVDIINAAVPKVQLSSQLLNSTKLPHQSTRKHSNQQKLICSSDDKKSYEKPSLNSLTVTDKHVISNNANDFGNDEISNQCLSNCHTSCNNESCVITVSGVQGLKRLSKRSLSSEAEASEQSVQVNEACEQEQKAIERNCKKDKECAERLGEDKELYAQEEQTLLTKEVEKRIIKLAENFVQEKEKELAKCFITHDEELKVICELMRSEALELNSLFQEEVAELKLTRKINQCKTVKQMLDNTLKEAATSIKKKDEWFENALSASDVCMQRHIKNWQQHCESVCDTMTSSTEELFSNYTTQLESFLRRHAETINAYCNTAKNILPVKQSQQKYLDSTTCKGEDSPVTKCCFCHDAEGSNYRPQEENLQSSCSRDAEELMCRVYDDCKESPSSSMGNTATTAATTTTTTRRRRTTTTTASTATTTRGSLENEFFTNLDCCESCSNHKEQKSTLREQNCAHSTLTPRLWEQTKSQFDSNITFANNITEKNNLHLIEWEPASSYHPQNNGATKARARSVPPKLDADALECQVNNNKFDSSSSADNYSEQYVRKLFEEFLKYTLHYLPLALNSITSSTNTFPSPCFNTSVQTGDNSTETQQDMLNKLLSVNGENSDSKGGCTPSVNNFVDSENTSESQKKSMLTKMMGTANEDNFATTESTPLFSFTPHSLSEQETKNTKWLQKELRASKLQNNSLNDNYKELINRIVNNKNVDNHNTEISEGNALNLCSSQTLFGIDDNNKANDDNDNQYSILTECKSSADMLTMLEIFREKWKRLEYTREQLHFAKRIWKLDMIEAKRCDVRSTSKRGQELKTRQTKIEKEMEVIQQNELTLKKILNELTTMYKQNKTFDTRLKTTDNDCKYEKFLNTLRTNKLKESKQMKGKEERESHLYAQCTAATQVDKVKEHVITRKYNNNEHLEKCKNDNKTASLPVCEKLTENYKGKEHTLQEKKSAKLMEMRKANTLAKRNENIFEGVDCNVQLPCASELLWNFLCQLASCVNDVKSSQLSGCNRRAEKKLESPDTTNRKAFSCQHISRQKYLISKDWNPSSEKFTSHKHKCKQ